MGSLEEDLKWTEQQIRDTPADTKQNRTYLKYLRELKENIEQEMTMEHELSKPPTTFKTWRGPWSKGPNRVKFWRGKE